MITGELKNRIDGLWDIFAAGGLVNPLDVIEQITYLMFIHDLGEHQRCGDLKNSICHVFGIAAILATQILDKGEYEFLHDGVHSACVKIVEHRPFQLLSVDFAVTHLHFVRKDALERQA